jgi:hypothetical protein
VPAAAVIPAPIAYIKVAAVKKLVVGLCGALCFLSQRTRAVCRKVVLTVCWGHWRAGSSTMRSNVWERGFLAKTAGGLDWLLEADLQHLL